MHETGIAASIYESARAAVEGRGRGRLESVKVAVGELSAVEPDLLTFAWEAIVAGGPDEGARLDIDWRPARQLCSSCNRPVGREEGTWFRVCSACGSPLRILGGDELDLLQLVYLSDEEET